MIRILEFVQNLDEISPCNTVVYILKKDVWNIPRSFKTISGFASCLWHVTVSFRVHALAYFWTLFTIYKLVCSSFTLSFLFLFRWFYLATSEPLCTLMIKQSMQRNDKQYVSTTIYVYTSLQKHNYFGALPHYTNCVRNLTSVPIDIYFN